MGVAVSFDYDKWIARYPEFSLTGTQPVAAVTAALYFEEATVYCRNDGSGPVNSATVQSAMLNALTAHIASLNAANSDGSAASSAPGRVSSATEGSVSVTTEFNMGSSDAAAYFAQTRYGADFWRMSAPYRMARFITGPGARRTFGRPPNTSQF